MRVPAVMLAAGGARRMGAQKLVLDIAGKPLVRRIAEAVLASKAGPLWVVTGAARRRVEAALDGLPLRCVHNPAWRRGLSHSLRCGLAAACAREDHAPRIPGVLIVLADQPAVNAALLDTLLERRARGEATRCGRPHERVRDEAARCGKPHGRGDDATPSRVRGEAPRCGRPHERVRGEASRCGKPHERVRGEAVRARRPQERGFRIVASDYGDALGPPVYFDASLFDALRALRGDEGARTLLQTQTGVARVAFPEGAFDLDTPADLARFRATQTGETP